MALIETFESLESGVQGIILGALVAVLAWILKALVEHPFTVARETFYRFVEKRVEVMGELRTALIQLALDPSQDSRNALRNILSRGEAVYVNLETHTGALEIANLEVIPEKRLLTIVKGLEADLNRQVDAVMSEYRFHVSFATATPFRKTQLWLREMLKRILAISAILVAVLGLYLMTETVWRQWGLGWAVLLLASIIAGLWLFDGIERAVKESARSTRIGKWLARASKGPA